MIRRLAGGDAGRIAALARAARFDAIPGLPDLHSPTEDAEFYTRQIDESPGLAFVDDDGGAVLGFVLWRGEMIEHLYVDVAHQRRGVGTALLEAACEGITRRPIQLWTFQGNARAVAFYRKHGFAAVEWTDGAGNEEQLPDVLFLRH